MQYTLTKWVEAKAKQGPLVQEATIIAREAEAALGFPVTVANFLGAARSIKADVTYDKIRGAKATKLSRPQSQAVGDAIAARAQGGRINMPRADLAKELAKTLGFDVTAASLTRIAKERAILIGDALSIHRAAVAAGIQAARNGQPQPAAADAVTELLAGVEKRIVDLLAQHDAREAASFASLAEKFEAMKGRFFDLAQAMKKE